jgi:hypothetical protein
MRDAKRTAQSAWRGAFRTLCASRSALSKLEVVFWLLCVALLVYEAVAILNPAPGDTISEIFWRLSEYPLVPFAFGFLCGHFFWQRRDR